MNKPILTLAAMAFLALPVTGAQAQVSGSPAGTDMTGTTETGIETTGTRAMTTGAIGSHVTGRGVGDVPALRDSNRAMAGNAADATPGDATTVSTDTAPTHTGKARHHHRAATTLKVDSETRAYTGATEQ